jgi:hypothetical protein
VFTYKKSTCRKIGASTNPATWEWVIFLHLLLVNGSPGTALPLLFESFSPAAEVAISACLYKPIIQIPYKLIAKLDNNNPDKKVDSGLVVMSQIVVFQYTPAIEVNSMVSKQTNEGGSQTY